LLNQVLVSFEQLVNSKIDFTVQESTIESLTQFLNRRKEATLVSISIIDQKIKDFNLLSAFLQNVAPYLKYEKAKVSAKDAEKRLKFLQEKVKPKLENERTAVSTYLNEQINSFFYEDLINDLYRRIDPHPDYKKIKFKCDFSDVKPRLSVGVYQTSEEELIIPNLYFSTAQLNILSLCIFLAKALNAKDEKRKPLDCIFIDDPIQSMDSINILSTIDLLRSIVVNEKKQIILSTHDENFHNLLRKKMPPELFKSKFMELETFGKVKHELPLQNLAS
jgi:exonuclease SbcC